MNSVVTCQCSEHGSVGFHNDERETLVLIEGKLYALTPTPITLEELSAMSAKEVPHVRHLNRIPIRTKKEQAVQRSISAHRVLEDAKKVVKEKLAEEYKVLKAKVAVDQPVLVKAPRVSKCRLVTEELHKRAMTVDDMMTFGIAKSTAETFKYDLRRAKYIIEEGIADGKATLKILEDPKAV